VIPPSEFPFSRGWRDSVVVVPAEGGQSMGEEEHGDEDLPELTGKWVFGGRFWVK
jgi:hypothetical protein